MANFKLEPIVLQNVNRTFMGQLTQLQNEKAVLTTQIETLEEDLQRMQKEYATALITNTTKLMKKDSACSKFDTSALEQALALLKERLAQMTNEITALESVIGSIKAIVNLVVTTDEEGASIVNSKMTVTDIMPLSSMEVAKSNAMSGYSNLDNIRMGMQIAGPSVATSIYGHVRPKDCIANTVNITEEQKQCMINSCNRIKEVYNNGNYSEDLKNYINAYLTPELLIAVSGTESGYFHELNGCLAGGGMGIVSPKYLADMPGGSGLPLDCSSYTNRADLGIDASATMLAYNMSYAYDHNSFGNCFNADGSINDGQLLYNALFHYGAGTDTSSYIGANNGETGMSTGNKMYVYAQVCNQTGGNNAMGYNSDLNTTISNYTNYYGTGNQWTYSFT